MMESEEYKELVESIAEHMKTIAIQLDMFLIQYDIESIDEIISNMEDNNSSLGAWPFSETMRKAEVMSAQTETFKKFRDLLKARKEQMDIQNKPDATPGQDILKALGMG